MMQVVIDTNVVVSALMSAVGEKAASRGVLRAALLGELTPLFGNALWLEYEDLLSRRIWNDVTTNEERQTVIAALAACGKWVNIYYGWRPNLPDEQDNHLIELAVAGNAEAIITFNKRDFVNGQLLWPHLRIITPQEYLKEQ